MAIAGGSGFNVTALVGLAFCIASSANFPALLFALFWPRFNTAGAIAGILTGVVSSLVLIALSAPVWPGADSDTGLAARARSASTTRRSSRSRSASWAAGWAPC